MTHPTTAASSPPAPAALLRALFDAAVAAAQPALCLEAHWPAPPVPGSGGRLIVIGAGKASAEMARVAEAHYRALGVALQGLVITRYGHGAHCEQIEIVEASHPVPDAAGLAAAQRMAALVQGLSADDVVLALFSGGGSALLVAPDEGLTLADKQAVHRALLASGAGISEMNCVRRHLSALKGGRLAALCHPAPVHTLLISDVPGDAPVDIASGPTVADASSCADALAIIDRYGIALPAPVRARLQSGAAESVKPGDPRLTGHQCTVVAAPRASLEAAAAVARAHGITPWLLGDDLEGEARSMGSTLAGLARQTARHQHPFARPCVLLSGGESTVTLPANPTRAGRGGRNVEFLLAFGLALGEQADAWALAADTDGIDGIEPIAGALWRPDSLPRAWAAGLNPREHLDAHDGHGFFQALGDSVITGPTLTNVNDFRALLLL